MFRSAIYTTILFMLAFSLAVPTVTTAQDDNTGSTSTDSGTSAQDTITFEGNEDASLFVGFYRLNPGDTIHVEIITDMSRVYDTMIDDEGFIALPVLGRVKVDDLTVSEARQALQDVADQYFRRAWITCRIVRIGRVKFYIYGDISQPGFYTASGATTFFDLLQRFRLAGKAEHRRIVHVRGERRTTLPEPTEIPEDEEEPSSVLIEKSLELFTLGKIDEIDPRVTIVDPLDFTLEGEIEQKNFYLEYGDMIYIPDPEVVVSIDGFRRSGHYEVLPGETWSDLIGMVGQASLTRDISNLTIERYDEEGNLVQLYYNLNYLNDEKLAMIPLENRDCLKALSHEGNIYVFGEVNLAGAFAYNATSNPLDYITLAGGPTTDAHLRFAAIIRPPRDPASPTDESEVFALDIVDAVNRGTAPAAVTMQPGDIIFIPDKGEEVTLSNILSGLSVIVNAVRLF